MLAAADVKCSGCGDNVPSAKVFACRNCTADKVVYICGFCATKTHRLHEVVELAMLAAPEEIGEAQREITMYNERFRKRAADISAEFELAQITVKRLVHVSQRHFRFPAST